MNFRPLKHCLTLGLAVSAAIFVFEVVGEQLGLHQHGPVDPLYVLKNLPPFVLPLLIGTYLGIWLLDRSSDRLSFAKYLGLVSLGTILAYTFLSLLHVFIIVQPSSSETWSFFWLGFMIFGMVVYITTIIYTSALFLWRKQTNSSKVTALILLSLPILFLVYMFTLARGNAYDTQYNWREAQVLDTVSQVQTALDFYYFDNDKHYPPSLSGIIIDGNCLSEVGFSEACSGKVYLRNVAASPSGGTVCGQRHYTYQSDSESYQITFCLEEDYNGIKLGQQVRRSYR